MRVLLVHTRYRQFGGEERHLDLIQQGLRDAGAEVLRLEAWSSEAGTSLLARAGVAARMVYSPRAARDFAAAMASWKPDVVHAHNLFPLLSPSVLHAAKRRGAAVVLTAHNYRLVCPSGTLLRAGEVHDDCVDGSSLVCGARGARDSRAESVAYGVALELQRRLGLVRRWVDAIVVPSSYVRDVLVRGGYPADRIRVIANGVPVNGGATQAGSFGLFAGRLSDEKGIRTLIAAARLAPDVPLVVAGDGPLAEDVRRSAGVRYAGSLDPDGLARLRRMAAFVVVPSECPDVLPFALLEGLADGKPALATTVGGLPEAVGDAGLLVPPGDPQRLAAGLRELWTRTRTDARLDRVAHATARERFELGAQVDRLLDLYGAVARR